MWYFFNKNIIIQQINRKVVDIMLEIKNISKTYKTGDLKQTALDKVNLI